MDMEATFEAARAWLEARVGPQLAPHVNYTADIIKSNPVHFTVEAFLVVFISYILLVKRSYDPAKR